MANPVGILPVGAGSKARAATVDAPTKTPVQSDEPGGSSARSRSRETNTPGRTRGRDALNAVAKDMSAGKYTSREQAVEIEGETPAREPSEVSDSAAIAPTKDPVPAKSPKPAKVEKSTKEPTAEEKAAAVEKGKKVAAAKRALALDGWEPEDIDALKEDRLLAIGAHRSKNQADVNREYDKLRKSVTSPTGARNADGTFAQTDTQPADKAAPETPADAAKDDPKPALATGEPDYDALIDAQAEDLGEKPTKLLKSLVKGIRAEFAAKMQGQAEPGNRVTTELLYSQGHTLLSELYPGEMADADAFDEVAENFKALVASGRYGRGQLSKAWKDAGHMAFGPSDPVRKAQRDMLARQDAADKGRVDPGLGDKGTDTEAPITNSRDALRIAGKMMAENPNADPNKLREAVMAKVRGPRAA